MQELPPVKIPKIEKHGTGYRRVWWNNGQRQRFFHQDKSIVERASAYIQEVGPNNITQDDEELLTLNFMNMSTGEDTHRQMHTSEVASNTFAAVADLMIAHRLKVEDIVEQTAKGYRFLAHSVFSDWADRDVATFRTKDLDERREYLRSDKARPNGKPYAELTIARYMGFPLGVLHFAFNRGLIAKDPTRGFDHNKKDAATKRLQGLRFIEQSLWLKILLSAKPEIALLMETLGISAMRINEVLGLHAGDLVLDVEEPYIEVQRQLLNLSKVNGQRVEGPPKYGSVGQVTITQELAAKLSAHLRQRKSDDPNFGPGSYLFVTAAGDPWWYTDWHSKCWKPMLARAQRSGVPVPAYLTPHVLRHSSGSWVLNKVKTSIGHKAVQQRLRHRHISTTLETYGHVDRDTRQAVLDALRSPAQ